ncbi:hypothetical protein DM02DRAFT_701083 [Periconia macrospinosa]|uniref:Fungal lipase-like domain-containing protein n=1 Tax=Periconia macrospinosa TaxID=97972 RepID=A0A2V1D2E5_9PLEO|nr:hypothetical protein DM02DRAFT_701083 [Periconia macrospinosa]
MAQLVEFQNDLSELQDIKDAANILWQSTVWRSRDTPDISATTRALREHYQNSDLIVSELVPGASRLPAVDRTRIGVVVCNGDKITIAFLGADPPSAFYENGRQLNEGCRRTWELVKEETYSALSHAVESMAARNTNPKHIILTGYSKGGGISVIAFPDILELIRSSWGSKSTLPKLWAEDGNLGSLVQHLTFAALEGGTEDSYTALNLLYETHLIRAWDFCHYDDKIAETHYYEFQDLWRGRRYHQAC